MLGVWPCEQTGAFSALDLANGRNGSLADTSSYSRGSYSLGVTYEGTQTQFRANPLRSPAPSVSASSVPPRFTVNAPPTLSLQRAVNEIGPIYASRGIDAGGVDAVFIARLLEPRARCMTGGRLREGQG